MSISSVDILSVKYHRFPLAYVFIHGEFGTIKCLNLSYTWILLLCQSHKAKCFEIHIFFVCYFVL